MQKITLQIPMDSKLKVEAEKVALEQGFSSLQELVRVILSRVAQKKIEVNFEEENVIHLSPKADRRYARIMRDIESGKEKVYTAKNIDDLMKQLNGEH